MELKLYKNISKKPNSTKRPGTADYTLDVKMKQGTSVEKPTFIVSTAEDLLEVNYAAFASHYYFVNDIVLAQNNLYEISCVQDVLATYKEEIGNYTAFVARSASATNKWIPDPLVSQNQYYSDAQTKVTSLNHHSKVVGCYVVRTISPKGINNYVLDKAQLEYIFGNGVWNSTNWLTDAITTIGVGIINPTDYILSCQWFPISKSDMSSNTTKEFSVGWITYGDGGQIPIAVDYLDYSQNLVKPDAFYDDWRDYSGDWTTCFLRVFGQTIPIDPVWLRSTLSIRYRVDVMTGNGTIFIYAADGDNDDALVTSQACQIGCPIQLSQSTSVNSLGAVTSLGSTVANIASQNYVGAAASASSIFANVSGTPITNGSQGNRAGVTEDVTLSVIHKQTCTQPSNVYGKPFYSIATINTLSGYIQCEGASFDLPGLAGDRTEINNFLNGGFYYE